MARGTGSQPESHWAEGTKCEIVFYEQSKHRKVSRGNGAGYAKGRGGSSSWQSHHLVCVSAVGERPAKDAETKVLLEKSLYITPWNINEAPNMVGLPMWRLYTKKYSAIDRMTIRNRDAAYSSIDPQNLPAHDVDHNIDDGFTDEVIDYLIKNVWNKFDSEGGDHKKDAEWLAEKLTNASTTFQGRLVARGIRKGGTVPAWKNRFRDPKWADPFSMAKKPTLRSPGVNFRDLTDIFSML